MAERSGAFRIEFLDVKRITQDPSVSLLDLGKNVVLEVPRCLFLPPKMCLDVDLSDIPALAASRQRIVVLVVERPTLKTFIREDLSCLELRPEAPAEHLLGEGFPLLVIHVFPGIGHWVLRLSVLLSVHGARITKALRRVKWREQGLSLQAALRGDADDAIAAALAEPPRPAATDVRDALLRHERLRGRGRGGRAGCRERPRGSRSGPRAATSVPRER